MVNEELSPHPNIPSVKHDQDAVDTAIKTDEHTAGGPEADQSSGTLGSSVEAHSIISDEIMSREGPTTNFNEAGAHLVSDPVIRADESTQIEDKLVASIIANEDRPSSLDIQNDISTGYLHLSYQFLVAWEVIFATSTLSRQ